MRKNISGKIALFGILALLVVLIVPSASAVDIYLRPDPAFIPDGECNSVTVDVLMKSAPEETVNSWGTWIQFDPTCVNITGYEYKSDMNSNTFCKHLGDRIKLWNYKAACSEYPDETVLVSLTVHCVNLSYCESPLKFVDNDVPPDKFVACVLEERTTTWHDGVVMQGTPCEPSIEVNKTVFDPETEEWVDEIEANIGEIVRFKCEIHNDGTCPLTGIVARDILSESLVYADNATVDDVPLEPVELGTNEFMWKFPRRVLEYCETITIEFDALVIDYGYDCNVQNATAIWDEIEVSDEDTACVDVLPCVPSIEVNKTVFDPKTGEWVDEIEANILEIVSFKCEIHNDGTCPLTGIVARDILSESLKYADNATVNGESWEPSWPRMAGPFDPDKFWWEFGEWELEPCETITIEFDALVISYGYDCNVQNATAIWDEIEVSDEDTACVDVLPCVPSIEVNKTVFDQETGKWVDEIEAKICENVRFKCEIHNDGTCPLTRIVAEDILSDSLVYADNATVDGQPWEPTIVNPNEFKWDFGRRVLEHCQTITIEFDAHVVKCGVDVNTQTVNAISATGEEVFDEDTATVVVPQKPAIEVNKTVWDGTAWVEETTAEIGEIVRFRCEMHNNGTCCPLTKLVVTDRLSDSLEYTDRAMVLFPNGTTMHIEPIIVEDRYIWEFPNLVLVPCETLTIEFNAKVVKCGVDVNTQIVTAVCAEEPGLLVSDEDTATVVVPPKPGIEVNKTVWDGTAWVEERRAEIGEIVRFRCEMHNNGTCCPLRDLVVTDILSESLKYADNAIVLFPDGTTKDMEPTIVDSTYVWEFPDLVLVPCQTLTIEFNAEVVKCGVDVNTQRVTAVCAEQPGLQVSDEDTATVVVPQKPGIEVNKTVWDKEREAWVDETTAEIGEIVRFRCEMHNNGTCCPLTKLVVTDILSESLKYADNAIVLFPDGTTKDMEPTIVDSTYVWEFPDLVLVPCQTLTIEFYAEVVTCGVDVNTQRVTAVCAEEPGLLVSDKDTATVIVPPKPGIEVNKTVWDKEREAWVDETTAEIGEIVRFRCEMHNNGTCCPLTNLVVTDILSDSLKYADNVTIYLPNGTTMPMVPTIVDSTYVWEFPNLVLVPCETLTIEFDAEVVKCGVDVNTQKVTAVCAEEPGLLVSDEDTATVIVPPKPGIEVNKTVWDGTAWVEERTAEIGEIVRFRCEMHNNGTCCPLTNLVVTDILSDSLKYADNVTIYLPNGTTMPMVPTIVDSTYIWEFPNLVLLPCETITIEFDAEVVKCGVDVNTQKVTAVCAEEPGLLVYDEDTATVIVPPKPGIEVNKTVWDGTAWVEERTAEIGEIVRFRCEMHNNGTCCPLTNLVVTDILSDSLEYADNVTIYLPDDTKDLIKPVRVDSTYIWRFPDLVLLPCETLTIEFDARVIDYGYDCNVQNATAICVEKTRVEVSDEDTACVDVPKLPDLTVTEITVNYDAPSLGGRAIGPEPGLGVYTECNNLSAVIEEENGVDVGSPFNVTFKVDGTTLCPVRVPGLTGGANKTVYCNCSWYPPYAGYDFAINVTVDSNHEIHESNETNNTKWNNGTVVSNGFKGDGWQGPDKNLINVQCHGQDTNNLIYSVGDSYYAKGTWGGSTNYVANWTTSDLPVPENADILKAWLYVYYSWDKNEIMPNGVSLTFNGPNVLRARDYSDRKGFGNYNYPYGMLVYNVTTEFNATGNKAVLTKASPDTYIPIKGMLLMVVYNHPDEPERIICIDEGYDMINAQASYAVTPEEATTYAPFECCEPIPLSEIGKATLVAVAPGASMGDDKNRLSFNDGLWNGAWSGFAGATELGIAEKDVRPYLKEEDNVANFQDRGDWMEASNAFLILEKEAPCPAEYAVYQAKVRDAEERLNELRALRDKKLDDGYVTRYYEHSPMLTLVLSRADSDLVKDGAQLLSKYSIPVGQHVQGMDVDERITKQDVEEALSFTERLKREVMKNRDAIGVKSTEAIIDFIDEFEGQVKASEGKTFSAALKSSIYYESGQLRANPAIVKE